MNLSINKEDAPRTLVMGIGNYLLGDEGVGVHFIKHYTEILQNMGLDVLDGGTGGFHLLGILENYPRVILVDATMDGNIPGTVKHLRPKFSADFPPALSAHDIGLKDLVEALIVRDKLPDIELITISIENIQPMKVTLSEIINQSLPYIFDQVKNLTFSNNGDKFRVKSKI